MDAHKARTRFTELRRQRDINPTELDEIWAALTPSASRTFWAAGRATNSTPGTG